MSELDPNDPTTWPASAEGAEAVGRMLADEFGQVLTRFMRLRIVPAVGWASEHGGDGRAVLREFAAGLRGVADSIDGGTR